MSKFFTWARACVWGGSLVFHLCHTGPDYTAFLYWCIFVYAGGDLIEEYAPR